MAEFNIPVIDLSRAADTESRKVVADDVVSALKTVGFLYVDNVPGFNQGDVFKWCQWFFNLPEETKSKLYRQFWVPKNKNLYRGCFPLQEGESSYKEGFEIGQDADSVKTSILEESNVWPETEGGKEFQKFMTSYYNSMWNTSLEMCRLICLGSGVREDYLEAMFSPVSLSTLRLLRYPRRKTPVPVVAMEDGVACCCADHVDTGFITLLTTFHYTGLQLKQGSGPWIDVQCRDKALVMNIGNLLSKMTGGCLKATRHRVVDKGVDRFSVPFFLEPKYDADIGPVLPCYQSNVTSGETKRYGDYRLEQIVQFPEYKHLKKLISQ